MRVEILNIISRNPSGIDSDIAPFYIKWNKMMKCQVYYNNICVGQLGVMQYNNTSVNLYLLNVELPIEIKAEIKKTITIDQRINSDIIDKYLNILNTRILNKMKRKEIIINEDLLLLKI